MPTSTVTAEETGGGDLGTYEQHIPSVRDLLSTLPEVRTYSTFKGGTVLKVNTDHYVAVLLPPTDEAEANLFTYLADHFDGYGDWEFPSIEHYGQVEAWHLTPPWAAK
jgi:hypothetical protein